ncbi:alpha-L-rhamnosidase-related protein [Anaerosporobacter sp.]|uniref:alpha-L-rhamnosidase-related protein n=1 Tax=Anaerosporobacter sp. TaxID=1872529 RepID=UPI00286F7856|nr:hypothetical protein [Anaerosporobacter sp.]
MSFFGYQYMEITTTADVTIYEVKARAVTSLSKQTGEINTNNKNVNRLFRNALYGQVSNYFTMITDCPQRDERKAWTGDVSLINDNWDAMNKYMNYQKEYERKAYIARNQDTTGYGDVAYDILLNNECSSWLHEVKAGATTIWERWNSYNAEE